MKDGFKIISNLACVKTSKTFVLHFNGNQEYLFQEVQKCYAKKKKKKGTLVF